MWYQLSPLAHLFRCKKKGEELNLPLYKFLKEPLTRRFGKEWYDELCEVADQLMGDQTEEQ